MARLKSAKGYQEDVGEKKAPITVLESKAIGITEKIDQKYKAESKD